jgi:DnaJ-class molecular chaperone
MKHKDYYKIMGVKLNASEEEITVAYRRLVRRFHPDVSKEPNASERFKEINKVYNILKSPHKRIAYNAHFKVICQKPIANNKNTLKHYLIHLKKNAGQYTEKFLWHKKRSQNV